MNSIPFIDASRVRQMLRMDDCINLMADTQRAISRGEIGLPLRSFLPVAEGRGVMGVMPGEIDSAFGAKLIALYLDNPAEGRPAIQGVIVVFDQATGAPSAIVDGAALTAIRTAAASAAATRALAREDAGILTLLGYGVQAETHLEAMCCVRAVREVRVWGPNFDKAQRFAERHSADGRPARAVNSSRDAVAGADLVCAVSAASEPIIKGRWLSPGCHLNLVGAHSPTTREADGETLRRARVFTEITQFAMAESGEIVMAIEEVHIAADDLCGEIGEVIEGRIKGRHSNEEITVYVSLGNTAQDLAAARFLASRLRMG